MKSVRVQIANLSIDGDHVRSYFILDSPCVGVVLNVFMTMDLKAEPTRHLSYRAAAVPLNCKALYGDRFGSLIARFPPSRHCPLSCSPPDHSFLNGALYALLTPRYPLFLCFFLLHSEPRSPPSLLTLPFSSFPALPALTRTLFASPTPPSPRQGPTALPPPRPGPAETPVGDATIGAAAAVAEREKAAAEREKALAARENAAAAATADRDKAVTEREKAAAAAAAEREKAAAERDKAATAAAAEREKGLAAREKAAAAAAAERERRGWLKERRRLLQEMRRRRRRLLKDRGRWRRLLKERGRWLKERRLWLKERGLWLKERRRRRRPRE
jgi:pyruvate/2-oxoglutarate dehydrogenase complex dihydrolipoamide acyltransferase (E2) component